MTPLNRLKRAIVRRPTPPPLRWTPKTAAGDVVPGGRMIRDGLRRRVMPAWPMPDVVSEDGAVLRFPPTVGTNDGCLVVFERAIVTGQSGGIELVDGSLLVEPLWHIDLVASAPAYTRRRFRRPAEQSGPWFSCLLHFAHGYYHWVSEVLPRFHRVLDLLPAPTRFVVPWSMQPWQWDSLEAIGISRDRCARLAPDREWAFDELYYAPPAAMTADHDADAAEWVRRRVLNAVGGNVEPDGSRLFVTRRHARSRRIDNEEAIWPMLARAGFERVEAEHLSFADQVRLFSRAACVAAPHGAGLANLMWCRPGTKVAEIFSPASSDRRCFWTLSAALKHNYSAVIGRDATNPANRSGIECSGHLAEGVARWASAPQHVPLSSVFR